jgi:hypothetical protein
MYEVRPDDKGHWVLYEVGAGDFTVVAWFVDQDDALFAKQAFEQRSADAHPPSDQPLVVRGSGSPNS